jgi:DNA-binding NtrC family response regulator
MESHTVKIAQSAVDATRRYATWRKPLIFRALQSNDNNRTKTADALGISIRTLRNKLREYREDGINVN